MTQDEPSWVDASSPPDQGFAVTPDGSDVKTLIKRLRRQLRKAIKDENYETAAELRDQIRRLEGGVL